MLNFHFSSSSALINTPFNHDLSSIGTIIKFFKLEFEQSNNLLHLDWDGIGVQAAGSGSGSSSSSDSDLGLGSKFYSCLSRLRLAPVLINVLALSFPILKYIQHQFKQDSIAERMSSSSFINKEEIHQQDIVKSTNQKFRRRENGGNYSSFPSHK